MTDMAAPPKPTTITTKHLPYALAEQHQLTKTQALVVLEDLVSLIIKHLKQGERAKIAGLGILQVRNRAAAWAAIRKPASNGEEEVPIIQRINRKLAIKGQVLKAARPVMKMKLDCGDSSEGHEAQAALYRLTVPASKPSATTSRRR